MFSWVIVSRQLHFHIHYLFVECATTLKNAFIRNYAKSKSVVMLCKCKVYFLILTQGKAMAGVDVLPSQCGQFAEDGAEPLIGTEQVPGGYFGFGQNIAPNVFH
jgi:hypothetical protein